MTVAYLTMFAFGFLLLASWAGWGALLERLLIRRPAADRALHAGWGLAWTCVAGGVLNLGGWIGPATTGLFVAVGVAALCVDVWLRRGRIRTVGRRWQKRLARSPVLALATLGLLVAVLAAYADDVYSTRFNPHDDLQAYLVFPTKMIQTGEMGPDPYSERRIVSLGAMSFLHAIVLAAGDWRSLGLIDPGISLVLVVALVCGLARDAGAPAWAAALVSLLVVALPPPVANVTSLVSGLALVLVLMRTLTRLALRRPGGASGAVLVALVIAAIASLKSSLIPPVALGVGLTYALAGHRPGGTLTALRGLGVVGGLTVVVLAPWMISLHRSSGTLLYPFLGRGVHGSAYGSSWNPSESLTAAGVLASLWDSLRNPRILPAWIVAGALLAGFGPRRPRPALVAFTVASLASYLLLLTVHERPAYRYSWAPLTACLLVFLADSLRFRWTPWPGLGTITRATAPAVLAIAVLAVAHGDRSRETWRERLEAIRAGVAESRADHFKPVAARRHERLQKAVPAGMPLLARLRFPFLLDFTRQTVFIVDYPGGASPPPGLPFFRGAEALAEALCAQGIRHVAYSFATDAHFSRARFGHRLRPSAHPWSRAQARHTFDFQDNLLQLGRTRRRLFDDGKMFVLDLGASPKGDPVECVGS